jgi:hypothetical protein
MRSLPAMNSQLGMSAYKCDETKPAEGNEHNPLNKKNEAHLQSRANTPMKMRNLPRKDM